MLLEGKRFLLGVIAILVTVLGTGFAVGAQSGQFAEGEEYTARFSDAAGLGAGDPVLVAGIRSGEVLGVDIAEGEGIATADFTLTAEQMPADSAANIDLSSTLGKRALEIEPGTSSEILEPGDVFGVERTSTPVDIPELGDRATELLGEVDVDELSALTTSLADATEGTEADLEELLTGIEDVTEIVVDRRDELETVIDRATTVVDAAADKDEQLVAIIDDFGSVLDRLVRRRDDISELLAETADTSTTTADLVAEEREQLDRTLASLHRDLEIVDAHQVDLAHTLAYLGVGFEGFASIGVSGDPPRDNPGWGNVFATNLGSVGIGALLECNGALDTLFSDLIGPDPRCEDIEEGENPGQGTDEEQDGSETDDSGQGPLGPVDPPLDLGDDGPTGPEDLNDLLGGGGLLGGGDDGSGGDGSGGGGSGSDGSGDDGSGDDDGGGLLGGLAMEEGR